MAFFEGERDFRYDLDWIGMEVVWREDSYDGKDGYGIHLCQRDREGFLCFMLL